MSIQEASLLSIGAATLVSFCLGFVWYGVLFSKPWMRALGIDREDVDQSGLSMGKAMGASVFASLLTALGIALLFSGLDANTWQSAGTIALLVWFAFSLTPMFKMIFWEDRPVTLFLIDGGYEFISIMSAASIIWILN